VLEQLLRRIAREEFLRLRGSARRWVLKAWSIVDGRPVVSLDGWEDELVDGVVAEPWGFASQPPAGTRLVLVQTRSGDLVAVAAEDAKTRPSTSEGGSVVYDSVGAFVRTQDGDARMESAGGATVLCSGDTIYLGGGTQSVAREGDGCVFTLTADLVTGVVTGTITIGAGAEDVRA
jgi:phage gp45-like